MFGSIWRKPRCCTLPNNPSINPPDNRLVFQIEGYSYDQDLPQWWNKDKKKMIPLYVTTNTLNTYYEWAFYKTVGDVCEQGPWYLSTNEDIMPLVYLKKGIFSIPLKVSRLGFHFGYTVWTIECNPNNNYN